LGVFILHLSLRTSSIVIDWPVQAYITTMANDFKAIHLQDPIPDLTRPFQITSPPSTDVWEKPPNTHSFNAPIIYRTAKLSSFQSATVTVSARWTHKYDQGGLCLVADLQDGRKWIKAGIELENGQANVGIVATDRWSDWSLLPIAGNEARVEMKAEKGSIWVWLLEQDGKRTPLREVTWWADLPSDAECWIGVYAAKPAPGGETEDLTVNFSDLSIRTS
jgi:uncharacterized protein